MVIASEFSSELGKLKLGLGIGGEMEGIKLINYLLSTSTKSVINLMNLDGRWLIK